MQARQSGAAAIRLERAAHWHLVVTTALGAEFSIHPAAAHSSARRRPLRKTSGRTGAQTARHVAEKEYPDIEFEDKIVDNMCMQLVQKPELYDVIVLPNLYGDVVSDLAAGLIGGLGLAPGANLGEEYAVFEPTHGSAPKYEELNPSIVNPIAMILSACMMLDHIRA